MARAFLGIGSNMGDRRSHVGYALRALARLGTVAARSPVVETLPVDCPGGPFLNACVRLETECPPIELLRAAMRVERSRGRRRSGRTEARSIDIDLLLYDDVVLDSRNLQIPHPRMHERRFVLEPLVAIAPDLVHPTLHLALPRLLLGLRAPR